MTRIPLKPSAHRAHRGALALIVAVGAGMMALIGSIAVSPAAAQNQPRAEFAADEGTVTMNVAEMNMNELLGVIARRYRKNIVCDPASSGTRITLQFEDVPVSVALERIAAAGRCRIDVVPNPAPNGRAILCFVPLPRRETMTPIEAAEVLGISVERLKSEIAAGTMTVARIGDDLLLTRKDLSEWLKKRGSSGLDTD